MRINEKYLDDIYFKELYNKLINIIYNNDLDNDFRDYLYLWSYVLKNGKYLDKIKLLPIIEGNLSYFDDSINNKKERSRR